MKVLDIDFTQPQVMTILNVTPDSFYADSRMDSVGAIERCVVESLEAGATIIDVGGYSSRPGADEVSPEEEWRRVAMGIETIRRVDRNVVISVDTFRGSVAKAVVERFGRVIINDISAGELDPEMLQVVADYNLTYIAMHMRGTPATMQTLVQYGDIVEEVVDYFRCRVEKLRQMGIRDIILDPGFGFAKTTEQNYELMRGLHHICELGYPVLSGVSRKSMIYKTLGTTPANALTGTIALNWESLRQGATILRVHDTREAVDTVNIFKAYRG